MPDTEHETRRAIEAILMVAESRSSRSCWPSSSRCRPRGSRSCAASWPTQYEADERGFVLVAVAGGWRFQSHARSGAVRRAVRARGPVGPAVGRRARDARHRRLQAAGVAGPGRRHPRRERRRRDAHAAAARLHRGGRPATRARPGGAVRHHAAVPREARPRTPSTTCRRSASSCPAPTSSRRSSRACAHARPILSERLDEIEPERRRAGGARRAPRRDRPRRPRRRGVSAGPTRATVSGSRRCSPRPGSAAAGPART